MESLIDAPDVAQDHLAEAMWLAGRSLGVVSLAIKEQELDDWIDELD